MAIIHFDEYKKNVRDVLDKVPVLRTDQLAAIVMRTADELGDDVDRRKARSILTAIQRNGYVLMNEDGWAMTKSAHLQFTNDKFSEQISYSNTFRINNELERIRYKDNNVRDVIKRGTVDKFLSRKSLDNIEAMWVVADMYPDSRDFAEGGRPFNYVFVQDGEPADEENGYPATPSICYEIIYMSNEEENALITMLTALPKIKNKDMRDAIRRIVIMENPSHAFKIPYLGVSHICAIDPTSETHYVVVETRSDDERWRDLDA